MQSEDFGFKNLYDVHEFFETAVLTGELPIHQTSKIIQLVFNLGFVAGQQSLQQELDSLQADADRYYRIAARGGFGATDDAIRGFYFSDLMGGVR